MDHKNATVIKLLTHELWDARRMYKDKKQSLECAVNYRGQMEHKLTRAKADEIRIAVECQGWFDRVKDLEQGLLKFGETV